MKINVSLVFIRYLLGKTWLCEAIVPHSILKCAYPEPALMEGVLSHLTYVSML